MKYHAPTNSFVIGSDDLRRVASHLRYAIRQVREQAGLPLTHYRREGALEAPQFAEGALLEIAEMLDIDLGASQIGRLDVSET